MDRRRCWWPTPAVVPLVIILERGGKRNAAVADGVSELQEAADAWLRFGRSLIATAGRSPHKVSIASIASPRVTAIVGAACPTQFSTYQDATPR